MYLSAIGYDIFPEGVGIKGTYTLADFLAIRDRAANRRNAPDSGAYQAARSA